MSFEFANPLFRNRKVPASEPSRGSVGEVGQPFEELKERVIILRKEDILAVAPAAPPLNWSAVEQGEIAVQLKDTEGLADGSVTIKASTLQRVHPALLPMQLEAEYLFPISLKTVVLQVQSHLRQSSEEKPEQVGADFDTPIAQAAREDEGFFKLAKASELKVTPIDETAHTKRKIAGPVLTPADRPSPPTSHRKLSPYTLTRTPSPSGPVGSPSFQLASSGTESRQAERAAPTIEAVAQSSLRRTGLERLQEIFMMDDQLDAPQVANLIAAFPKVKSALVMRDDGTVLGGNVPDGYHLETALLAPVIMRDVQEFDRRLRSHEMSAFTLLGGVPVTLFAEGNICILISHEGRGLVPGVRERIGEVARALDAAVS
jgi:hypothetical protein